MDYGGREQALVGHQRHRAGRGKWPHGKSRVPKEKLRKNAENDGKPWEWKNLRFARRYVCARFSRRKMYTVGTSGRKRRRENGEKNSVRAQMARRGGLRGPDGQLFLAPFKIHSGTVVVAGSPSSGPAFGSEKDESRRLRRRTTVVIIIIFYFPFSVGRRQARARARAVSRPSFFHYSFERHFFASYFLRRLPPATGTFNGETVDDRDDNHNDSPSTTTAIPRRDFPLFRSLFRSRSFFFFPTSSRGGRYFDKRILLQFTSHDHGRPVITIVFYLHFPPFIINFRATVAYHPTFRYRLMPPTW